MSPANCCSLRFGITQFLAVGLAVLLLLVQGSSQQKVPSLKQVAKRAGLLPAGPKATVNLTDVRQTIEGFGWASFGIANVSDYAFDSLYLNDEPNDAYEMGLKIHRVIVGYNNSWEPEMLYAQKTQQRGAIVIASVLTPPPEMKSNNNASGGSLLPDKYEAYAAYLKNISDYYSSNNVSLYAISVANEPDINKYTNTSNQYCAWTAQELLNFVKNYGDKVGTKLIVAESYAFDKSLTNPILNDAKAAANVAFIGGHLYAGNLTRYALAQQKNKSVWVTEYADFGNDSLIENVLATAKRVHDSLTIGEANAYVTFDIMVGDQGPSLRGFGYGQYAKFVRPGFQRVGATYSPAKDVFVSAYKGGNGKVVIVVINLGTTAVKQQFSLVGTGANKVLSLQPRYTNVDGRTNNDTAVVVAANGVFSYKLPAQSITTLSN